MSQIAPLPYESVVLVYRVTGPKNVGGTMELLAKPGGYRRENWNVAIEIAGAEDDAANITARHMDVRTTVIRTPDATWRAQDGEPGVRQVVELGSLADGYLELEAAERHRVARTLHRWQRELQTARHEHPGTKRTILGIDCLELSVAGQRVCLWEAADIALSLSGDGLRLEATSIETDVELGPHAFDIPTSHPTVGEPPAIDTSEELRWLADGRYASLALMLSRSSAGRIQAP